MSSETVRKKLPDWAKNVEVETIDEFSVLPGAVQGLATTFKHFFRKPYTLNYPTQASPKGDRYRGMHRLKKDEFGRPKCVACFMCETICPAECITIVAEEAPWDDREKVCKSFDIDELRCIFCGYCEEACPCDAIELTDKIGFAGYSRKEMVYNKDKLLWD